MEKYTLFIAGAESTGKFKTVKSPYDGKELAQIETADAKAVEIAFQNAVESHEKIMKNMPAYKRAEILQKVADQMKENVEGLAMTIALEGGKPLKDARVEVLRAIDTVRMTAEECTRMNGEQITMDRSPRGVNRWAFTIRQGIGPVMAISAFNHPVNLICHQLAPAIGAGNSVLLKPASQTMISAFKIVEIFRKAGLDKKVISILSIPGSELDNYISDKRIRFITFIGSAEVGWNIQRKAADGVHFQFEHGGTGIQVVDKSAEIDKIIDPLTLSGYYHAGQVCVSTQIIYVHEAVYDEFLSKYKASVSKLKTGNPAEDDTFCGPLITLADCDRVNEWIEEAKLKGATVELGGNKISDSLHEPTILTGVTEDMKVWTDEVFGPVVSIIKYNDLDQVIEAHNGKPYSFQTAIYSKDIDTALYYAKRVESKACMINDHTAFRVDWMPFGGSKESGLHVEGMKYALADMSEEKLIVIKSESL